MSAMMGLLAHFVVWVHMSIAFSNENRLFKVLFLPPAARSHILPELALAKGAMERGGIRAMVALPSEWKDTVNENELEFIDLGPERYDPLRRGEIHTNLETTSSGSIDSSVDKANAMSDIHRILTSFHVRYRTMKEPTNDVVQRIQPDLIVVDSICHHAIDIAKSKRIPFVQVYTAPPMEDISYSYAGAKSKTVDFISRLKKTFVNWTFQLQLLHFFYTRNVEVPFRPADPTAVATLHCTIPGFHFRFENLLPSTHYVLGYFTPAKPSSTTNGSAWLDSLPRSDHAIYVSFGTHVQPSIELYAKVVEGTLAISNQTRVIVSTRRTEHLKRVLDAKRIRENRVRIENWVDQSAILSHERTTIFISHGGMGGISEALHAGTPMIVIPFWGDQPLNGYLVDLRRVGVSIDKDALTVEKVSDAVREIMQHREEYAHRVRELDEVRRLTGGVQKGVDAIESALIQHQEVNLDIY